MTPTITYPVIANASHCVHLQYVKILIYYIYNHPKLVSSRHTCYMVCNIADIRSHTGMQFLYPAFSLVKEIELSLSIISEQLIHNSVQLGYTLFMCRK